jgi:hypothetical protein
MKVYISSHKVHVSSHTVAYFITVPINTNENACHDSAFCGGLHNTNQCGLYFDIAHTELAHPSDAPTSSCAPGNICKSVEFELRVWEACFTYICTHINAPSCYTYARTSHINPMHIAYSAAHRWLTVVRIILICETSSHRHRCVFVECGQRRLCRPQ